MKFLTSISLINLAFFVGISAQAYEKKASEKKVESVTLSDSVTLSELEATEFKSVAHGLRNKKVAFMNFKVYVLELLVPATVTWDNKPATLEGAPKVGMQMTYLRDVPAKNIAEAFEAGLKENKAELDSAPIKSFLETVKKIGDIKDKETFVIARSQAADADKLLVLIPGRVNETITGPKGWTNQVLKIWSGAPSDSGMTALQKELFK